MFMKRRAMLSLAAGVAAVGVAGTATLAQDAESFPEEPIQFVVPYSAGGGQDTWARFVASSAAPHMGQPVNVEVRPGAGGVIGWRYMLDQPADGYTMMIGSLSPMIAALSEEDAPISIDDVKIVSILSSFNPHVMALPDSGLTTWEDVAAYAEDNPGELTIGATLAQALAAAAVFDEAGLNATFIPYPGTSAAVTDMLGGHIDMAVVTPATAISLGDEAVPVANIGDRPNSDAQTAELGAEVPWIEDLGYQGVAQPRWVGVHPDTPDEIVAKLDEGLHATLQDESVIELISRVGEEVIYSGTEEAQQTYQDLISVIENNLPALQ
jgi:tripartite-type tricarboxylate transporter receptor subunit TctC